MIKKVWQVMANSQLSVKLLNLMIITKKGMLKIAYFELKANSGVYTCVTVQIHVPVEHIVMKK